jgi:hypothetical protein
MRQLGRSLDEFAVGHPVFTLLLLFALSVLALYGCYRCMTQGGSGGQMAAAVVFLALSIGAIVWHLLRFAGAIGQGGHLS